MWFCFKVACLKTELAKQNVFPVALSQDDSAAIFPILFCDLNLASKLFDRYIEQGITERKAWEDYCLRREIG